ncbi:unnamed protein product [Schistocephalus solidus]|uniref:C2H2-type domain-containing protein n=1 Tax=Schistocephalus solidus TaxID=70667 RepID=A0A183TLR5_SCHSO|nr:unnamed protein product [Schistocephalus solidus]
MWEEIAGRLFDEGGVFILNKAPNVEEENDTLDSHERIEYEAERLHDAEMLRQDSTYNMWEEIAERIFDEGGVSFLNQLNDSLAHCHKGVDSAKIKRNEGVRDSGKAKGAEDEEEKEEAVDAEKESKMLPTTAVEKLKLYSELSTFMKPSETVRRTLKRLGPNKPKQRSSARKKDGNVSEKAAEPARILKVRWQDRIPDTEVMERTGILSILAMLRQVQLRWSGHLVRMDDERLPKRFFYRDVRTGARRQGGQKRRYKDTEEISEAIANQPETTSKYSSPVTSTTAATTTISDGDSLLNCRHCDCTFTSRIGLVGYLRIHRTEAGEPVPGAPTHSRAHSLHYPHCPRAFTHRIGLFGHMRIHENLRVKARQFARLTELAVDLLGSGDFDIYRKTKKVIDDYVATAREVGEENELDAFGAAIDDAQGLEPPPTGTSNLSCFWLRK